MMPAGGTDTAATPVVARITEAARDLVAGRRVILAGVMVAGATPVVAQLRKLGADRCFVIGPAVGTGELPDPAHCDWWSLDITGADTMQVMRKCERALADPPPGLAAALDAFDPDHDALVLVDPPQRSTAVSDRPAFGARRPAWVQLEDKTTNDALFHRAGVIRPPAAAVVAADHSEGLLAATARLDQGQGTVWAGDARDGFNGGATLVRWITDDATRVAAQTLMAGRCDRIRVAPFMDGIPCSIHGLVTTDGIAVFRPVEMVTLRTADPPGLRYAGAADYWDPAPPDRAAMRNAARRVGALLRDEVGYGGFYGIDGVLTADGFRPTELNPRFGAGLTIIARALPDLPLLPLHWLAAARQPLPATATEIEAELTAAADTHRGGGGWLSAPTGLTTTVRHQLVIDDRGDMHETTDGEPAAGELIAGPGAEDGFVRFTPNPDRTPTGPSIAPLVCTALRWADTHYGLGLRPLAPALSA